jgi:carboxymethylenebutenolidase
MNLRPILLAAVLLTTLVSATGSSYAQPLTPATTTVHVTSPAILKGSIANVQLDADGNPEWIESGFWFLRLTPGGVESDLPSAQILVRISMVGVDGSAAHEHAITNYVLTGASMEGNTTHVFEGTATVTMRDGPVSDVPLTIKIFNNAAIGFWIGPDKINSHFGEDPVYGTLSASARQVAANMREGMSMSDRPGNANERPGNATGVALERSDVNYYGNATGYLVQPRGQTDLPAVVMIHEWWGVNQYIKGAADRLAAEGYVVLAADLYSSEVATVPERARELSGSVRNNPAEALNNLHAAVEYVSELPSVNGLRVAALGWCFGGGYSMQLALNTTQPLAATVIYYGNLVTDEQQLSAIEWPVMGVFGTEDQAVPVETAREFDAALDAAGVVNEIYIYEGVGHAFANPSGDNYAPEETADAWEKTLAFLSRYV